MQLAEIMSRRLVTVGMDDSLRTVRGLFNQHRYHHLLVMDHGRLVGVVSDRDLLRNLSPFVGQPLSERRQDAQTLEKRVHQIMTRQLVTVAPIIECRDAARIMLKANVSCLPVVEEPAKPVGIVTSRDLLRALALAIA